jgi:hypothetical protein
MQNLNKKFFKSNTIDSKELIEDIIKEVRDSKNLILQD